MDKPSLEQDTNPFDRLLDELSSAGFLFPYQNGTEEDFMRNRDALLTALVNSGWAAG